VGATKAKLSEQGWVFEMQVQFVEIYNETLRDLLNQDPDSRPSLRILRDAYGMTEVEGVVKMGIEPENKAEVDKVMTIAGGNRSVMKTDMNAESSRSHSIFTLHLVARNHDQNAVLRGQLNLVISIHSQSSHTNGVSTKLKIWCGGDDGVNLKSDEKDGIIVHCLFAYFVCHAPLPLTFVSPKDAKISCFIFVRCSPSFLPSLLACFFFLPLGGFGGE